MKILPRLSEVVHTNISDHFPKMTEGCRIFPSNFGSLNNQRSKLDNTYDVIDIFTSEDIMFSQ